MARAEATQPDPTPAAAADTEEPAAAPADAEGEPWARILSSVQAPAASPLPTLTLAPIDLIEGERVLVRLGGAQVPARVDAGVHPLVLAGAHARGERVLVEVSEGGAPVIVGALRTQPTPGIDAAEEYTIEAARVSIRGSEEVSISAQAASVVLRALGEVETYADRILSRAEGVHKIVGRMLRLN